MHLNCRNAISLVKQEGLLVRFIGNKDSLVDTIYNVLQHKEIEGKSFFDFFSGTTNVARFFKKMNYQIYSSDLLYFSYCLQKAYLINNADPSFESLLPKLKIKTSTLFNNPFENIIDYLNNLAGIKGFIYKNYTPEGTKSLEIPRMYFTSENGAKIDAIRQIIEEWYQSKNINENEYYILLTSLIEAVPFYSNISGVYGAFFKHWDRRALKPLQLKPINIIEGTQENQAFNTDSTTLIKNIDVDILYLDPPYNNRQYAPNYHVLETIAKYDNPIIKGITGMRDYKNQKSNFCNKSKALEELDLIASKAKYKHLILSYNNEGIMTESNILDILNKYGKTELVEFDYLRFKSHNIESLKTKKYIKEQLYILSCSN